MMPSIRLCQHPFVAYVSAMTEHPVHHSSTWPPPHPLRGPVKGRHVTSDVMLTSFKKGANNPKNYILSKFSRFCTFLQKTSLLLCMHFHDENSTN